MLIEILVILLLILVVIWLPMKAKLLATLFQRLIPTVILIGILSGIGGIKSDDLGQPGLASKYDPYEIIHTNDSGRAGMQMIAIVGGLAGASSLSERRAVS
jgi:hypothetical protein